jgi:NIMA (never in mitosis gene a)-related kinase
LYAMKQICLDPTKKSRTKEAVMKEVQILSKLKHTHVVRYKESFFDDKEHHLYIVQDYCDWGTLQSRLMEARQAKQPLPEEQIMKWFVQVTMALQHIHSQKVLHRDLKPQNIFLTKGDVIKVGDFGISKLLDNTLDMAQTCVGTPYYLSPELCQDTPYNSKSDMWALGCLLYELCDLHPPFNASSLIGLIYAIVKGNYKPLSARYSELIHLLVRQLLSKSPSDRPSAASILNMVEVRNYLSVLAEHPKTPLNKCYDLAEHADESRSEKVDEQPATDPGRSQAGIKTLFDYREALESHWDSQAKHPVMEAVWTESVETGHYSDDFDDCSVSSDDDGEDRQGYAWERRPSCDKDQDLPLLEMSDHVHATQQISVSLDKSFPDPIVHSDIPVSGQSPVGTQELGQLDENYVEDFEDSESDDSELGAIAAAQSALGVTAEEHFIADEDTDVSYKQALREYDLLCLCNAFNTLST